MRIRQVKPAFWSDPRLSTLSEACRLFYIGLWMLADDAGWFRWDVAEVAHALYGYEDRRKRERRVAVMFGELLDAGRVVVHECGHVEVPTLIEHQRMAGSTRQVRTCLNEHMKECVAGNPRTSPHIPAEPRVSPPRNGIGTERISGTEMVGNGTERNGRSAQSANEETTEFRRLVPIDVALGSAS